MSEGAVTLFGVLIFAAAVIVVVLAVVGNLAVTVANVMEVVN